MAKKVFKYQLLQEVWPNEKSRSGYPSGLEKDDGIIISQMTDSVHFDYEVKFDDATTCRYKEEELDDVKNTHEFAVRDTNEFDQVTTNKDMHKEILEQIHDVYVRKNADYNNSFEEQFKEYGLLSGLIRIDDKVRRLKNLRNKENQVKDESIEDTLLDLCGYAILTLMEIRKGDSEGKVK